MILFWISWKEDRFLVMFKGKCLQILFDLFNVEQFSVPFQEQLGTTTKYLIEFKLYLFALSKDLSAEQEQVRLIPSLFKPMLMFVYVAIPCFFKIETSPRESRP